MIEANKTLVRRYIEEFVNTGDLNKAEEFIAPGFVHLTAGFKGVEGYRKHVASLHSTFPDFNMEIQTMIGETDVVAFFSIWRGTHKGSFVGVAPTGKKFEFRSAAFRRVRDGKIVEAWGAGDQLAWFQQLGIIPSPAESSAVNKEIVRRFFDEMVTGARLELVDELVDPGFVRHVWAFGKPVDGHGGDYMKRAITNLHEVFEGFHERVQQVVAEGDLVACRVDWGGRHRGEIWGVAPTGREVNTESYRILRIKNGKAVEMWSLGDNYGQLLQLGVLPPR